MSGFGERVAVTRMLASVTSPAEAAIAAAGGADLIDLKDPARGALGALAPEAVREIVRALDGAVPTSATVGDLPMEPARLVAAVAEMAETGVDFVKVGLFEGPQRAACIRALAPLCRRRVAVVMVMFADRDPDLSLLAAMVESGVAGVMLDTAVKAPGVTLRRCLGRGDLKVFVERARARDLLVGLAGSLRAEDVPPLLAMGPDYLGFRGALCAKAARTGGLDPAALAHIRALIPRPDRRPKSAAGQVAASL